MNAIITSYKNPDTDGFASAVGYQYLLQNHRGIPKVAIQFAGQIDEETKFAISLFPGADFQLVANSRDASEVYLVDTHHLAQVGELINPKAVRGIYDHHPNGDSAAFPEAVIINEQVGAAATLVVEALRATDAPLPAHVAGLLLAGIVSNTLGFKAPTTTDRDRIAAEWVRGIAGAPADFDEKLVSRRGPRSDLSTAALLGIDCKIFEFGKASAALTQLEADTAAVVAALGRPDLVPELEGLRRGKHADVAIFNAVDISRRVTFLGTGDRKVQEWLAANGVPQFENAVSRIDRIFIRKSDIVPLLNRYFGAHATKP